MRPPWLGAIMDSVLPTGGRGENVGAEAPKRDAAAAAIDAADAVMAGPQHPAGPTGPSPAETPLPSRVLAALPVGVALLDSELCWRYANDAFLRLTGLPAEATSGWPLRATALSQADALGSGESAAAAHAAAQVLADGETRELVAGPTDEPIRMRLQRVDPGTPPPADTGTWTAEASTPGAGPNPNEPLVLIVALLDATPPAPAAPAAPAASAAEPTDAAQSAEAGPRATPPGASPDASAASADATRSAEAGPGAIPPGGSPDASAADAGAARSAEAGPGAIPPGGSPDTSAASADATRSAQAERGPIPPGASPDTSAEGAGAARSAEGATAAPGASAAGAARSGEADTAARQDAFGPTAAADFPDSPFAAPAAPGPAPSEGELRIRRRLATLTAAGERIGTTLDTDTTCAELARFTVPGLADLATVDILPPGVPDHRIGIPLGTVRLLRAAVAGRPELHQQLATLAHPGESVRHREGSLVARSLVAGKPVVLDLAAIDEGAEGAAAISDPATLEVYRAAGITSVVAVPLAARGHLVGALILARGRHEDDATEAIAARGADFSDDDLALIEDLAGRAALSIDNARRYMRSQGIALELQRALLAEPANPHPNMEIACRYLPSGSSSVVGGDWYESVRLPFGRTLLVIGDVMGHGVEAAVDMSTYRSMLRYVAVMDLPPHRILRQLDAMISENDAARPATCLLALVDPPRSRVTFASAGHLPPALVSANGVTELVPVPSGPPLGTGVGGYQQLVRELGSGDVLLLYTDGLVERRHEDIDVSLERLAALPLPAAGDLDDLLDAALHSSTPSEAEDDIAVLAARVRLRP